jgi:hypothetical protein
VEEVGVLLIEPAGVGKDGPGGCGLAETELAAGQPGGIAGGRERLIEEDQRVASEPDRHASVGHSPLAVAVGERLYQWSRGRSQLINNKCA